MRRIVTKDGRTARLWAAPRLQILPLLPLLLHVCPDDLLLVFERFLNVLGAHDELAHLGELYHVGIDLDCLIAVRVFLRLYAWRWVSRPLAAIHAGDASAEQVLVRAIKIGRQAHIHLFEQLGIDWDRRATRIIG